jgi:hypothetical protein
MSDRRSDAFQRALDEARRQDRALSADRPEAVRRPRLRASLAFGPAPGSGGEARFGLALDWTDEGANPLRPRTAVSAADPAPSRADTPAEIAAELGLAASPTPNQLASRWRDFVWRNHPDRQPREARERANARVAIANTLYEQARRGLIERK